MPTPDTNLHITGAATPSTTAIPEHPTCSMFLDVVPEKIRKRILSLVVTGPGLIQLSHVADLLDKRYQRHLEDCWTYAGSHRRFQQILPHASYFHHRSRESRAAFISSQFDAYVTDAKCIDPLTTIGTPILLPDTRLIVRQVCKQLDREATLIFFTQNTFAFGSVEDAHKVLTNIRKHIEDVSRLPNHLPSQYAQSFSKITKVSLHFTSEETRVYKDLAQLLKGMEEIVIHVNYKSPLVTFGPSHAVSRNKLGAPLKTAIGLHDFIKAFGARRIREVTVAGIDLREIRQKGGSDAYFEQVDANHADGVGPVLRQTLVRQG